MATRHQYLQLTRPIARRVAIGLIAILAVYLVTISPFGIVTRNTLYADVADQLGFHHYTPSRDGRERLALSTVREGSPMHAAGFRAGDELDLDAVDEFYYRIATNPERRIRFDVLRAGQRREIWLVVPQLRLRSDPRKALWFR